MDTSDATQWLCVGDAAWHKEMFACNADDANGVANQWVIVVRNRIVPSPYVAV